MHFVSILPYLIISLYCACTLNCEVFKNGSFIEIKEGKSDIKIFRYEKEQIEVVGDTIAVFYNLNWNSTCQYRLISKKILYKGESLQIEPDTTFVNITEILNETSYKFMAINGKDTITGTMKKISDEIIYQGGKSHKKSR